MNKEMLQPVRGMRDFGPLEASIRRAMLARMGDSLVEGKFLPLELPRLEHLELLQSHITNEQGQEVAVAGDNHKLIFPVMKRGEKYDKAIKAIKEGSEEIPASEGLIFDHTLSLLRYHVKTHGKGKGDTPKEPFKYYQIGDVWRAERPQKGRYRQFKQVDMDIIYGEGQEAHEFLEELRRTITSIFNELINRYYSESLENKIREIKEEIRVYWNSTELADKRFKSAEVPEKKYADVARCLDKYHKVGNAEVDADLEALGLSRKCARELLDNSNDKKQEELENEKYYKGASDQHSVFKGYDPFLLRGMNYYNGYMFELRDNKTQIALGGGGCYDGLAKKLFGAEWGGVGFSFGFDRIYDFLLEKVGIEGLKDMYAGQIPQRFSESSQ